jgi:hypothetical protein
MAIRFDPEKFHAFDDVTGDYLEGHSFHYQDPLRHYYLRSKDGEKLMSASVAERHIDTRGDKTVGLVDANLYRLSIHLGGDRWKEVRFRWHPAVRRFRKFFEVQRLDRQTVPRRVWIGIRLGAKPPPSQS